MIIRRLEEKDARAVSELIITTIRISKRRGITLRILWRSL